ncbi:MAG: Na/Pi cotransporter family protein [Lachnospiraceae bacterium]|nr:Na/Pi cotransporter family protein [Lachnospiraceae bacterium]
MNSIMVATAILNLLAGIGIFLVACSMMSSNLEALSSDGLKVLFSKVSKSKWLGVGIGAVGTAAIQSSGATTVMTIGFVNAGIMSLYQAATIIYGANIGTTITGQIVALGMISGDRLSTTIMFSGLAGVGSFIKLFSKKDTPKLWGGILSGFGMLFVGLSIMSGAMESFAELDAVKAFLASITNMFLLVIIGAVLTAIVQSSSVMTSVAITMLVAGLITLDQGIFLTMGSNIGSCVVALLAGLSGSKNAKRTSFIHLLFNVSGVVVFLFVGFILPLASGGSISYGGIFESLFPSAPQTQLAMFHTVFNVLTVLLIMPATNILINIVKRIVPDIERDEVPETKKERLYYVDENMLKTPVIAVKQVKNEIVNMADIALRNFATSLDIVCTLDFTAKEEFEGNEKQLNFINRELVKFIIELSKAPLNEKDHTYLSSAIRTISDLERVGDYAENIVGYAKSLSEAGDGFSTSAIAEIRYVQENINTLFENVMKAYINIDFEALEAAYKVEDEIDRLTGRMEQNHIIRLEEGICTPIVGAHYLSLSANTERIADHLINVAKSIKQLA